MNRWILIAAAALATLTFFIVQGRAPEAREMSTAPAVDSVRVDLVAERGGRAGLTYAVDVLDEIAVLGRGDRLVLAEVSDPAAPRELSAVSVGGVVRDVKLTGRRAYAAADSGGLSVVDVSDPTSPHVVHTVKFDDRAYGVDVQGSLVFVAARSKGLRVLDASGRDSPREVGFLAMPDEAVDVVVRGRYAYVAAWYESMRVVDISDPTAPEEVSFVPYDSYDNGAAWSVAVAGDLSFAAVPEVGLRTADISNPEDVKLHRVYRGLLAPASAEGRGTIVFVADQEAGLRILDLRDPEAPFEIGALELPGSALSITLSGDHAFIAAREAGLRIVNVSSPHDPREISFLDADDDVYAVSTVSDTMLAVGTENGVELVSINDPDRSIRHLPVRGDRLFVHDDRFLIRVDQRDVRVVDLAEQDQPAGATPAAGHGPPEAPDAALVAAGTRGIVFVDPHTGRTADSFRAERSGVDGRSQEALLRSPLSAWDVVVVGAHAFAAFDDGIHVLELANPGATAEVAVHGTPQRPYRLLRQGNRLYAACDDGLRVLDISDRTSPREHSFHRTPSFATSLAFDGSRLYVGDLAGNVSVFAVSDDTAVRRIGVFAAADRILSLAVTPIGLAIAAGSEGLRIVTIPAGDLNAML